MGIIFAIVGVILIGMLFAGVVSRILKFGIIIIILAVAFRIISGIIGAVAHLLGSF